VISGRRSPVGRIIVVTARRAFAAGLALWVVSLLLLGAWQEVVRAITAAATTAIRWRTAQLSAQAGAHVRLIEGISGWQGARQL
jgi:hypothetical protein